MSEIKKIHSGRELLLGNVAAAYAALLARVKVVAAYPITPQTTVVEKLAEWAPHYGVEYIAVESEHSMVAAARGATKTGARSFCATSSHGLAYAHEQLQMASRERIPLVMVNVNRCFASPWHLTADLQDSMSQRDTGWIQLYCSSPQEILDTVLCAFGVAERLMLPVMVCYEGFTVSHLGAPVIIPDQATADKFVPDFNPPANWLLSPDHPATHGPTTEPEMYAKHQQQINTAILSAEKLMEETATEFTQTFKRRKIGPVEVYGNARAPLALITCGAAGETAKIVFQHDKNVLLIRLHMFRPFPKATLARALSTVRKIAVLDRSISFGSGGPMAIEVKDIFYHLKLRAPDVFSFIDVGGTDITPNAISWILEQTRSRTSPGRDPIFIPEEVK